MANVQHNTLTGGDAHEPKGTASATVNQTYVADGAASGAYGEPEPKGFLTATLGDVYMSDGAGSGSLVDTREIVRMGIQDWNDLGTVSSPISLPAGTPVVLTNDGAGAFTSIPAPLTGVGNMWNTSTDRLDFTDFNVGDKIELRIDITPTTTAANTVIDVSLSLGEGGSPYTLPMGQEYYKSSGAQSNFITPFWIYLDANTKNNPASIKATSDAGSATVVVAGWAITGLKRGLV